jgi:ABC-type antimicrobial peptide transport system permease subunit
MALAAVGLFGVTAYAVAERAPEIGIRRALGASRRQILTMILREMGLVLAVGVVAGLGLSWLARSLIHSFLFGVAGDDPWTIVGVCLSTVTVGLLAALAPAQAAARVAPSRALAGR